MKFGTAVLHTKTSSKCEFRKSRLSDSRTLLKGAYEFPHTVPHFLSDLGEIKH